MPSVAPSMIARDSAKEKHWSPGLQSRGVHMKKACWNLRILKKKVTLDAPYRDTKAWKGLAFDKLAQDLVQ
jgi:hypothetical protein